MKTGFLPRLLGEGSAEEICSIKNGVDLTILVISSKLSSLVEGCMSMLSIEVVEDISHLEACTETRESSICFRSRLGELAAVDVLLASPPACYFSGVMMEKTSLLLNGSVDSLIGPLKPTSLICYSKFGGILRCFFYGLEEDSFFTASS